LPNGEKGEKKKGVLRGGKVVRSRGKEGRHRRGEKKFLSSSSLLMLFFDVKKGENETEEKKEEGGRETRAVTFDKRGLEVLNRIPEEKGTGRRKIPRGHDNRLIFLPTFCIGALHAGKERGIRSQGKGGERKYMVLPSSGMSLACGGKKEKGGISKNSERQGAEKRVGKRRKKEYVRGEC